MADGELTTSTTPITLNEEENENDVEEQSTDDGNDDGNDDGTDDETDDNEDEGSLPIAKRKKEKKRESAPVWEFGGVRLEDGTQKCLQCSYFLTPNKSNTGNLTSHILSKHRESGITKQLKSAIKLKKKKAEKKRQKEDRIKRQTAGMLKFVNRQPAIVKSRKLELDEAIVKHLVSSNNPFSEVEEWSFRNLFFKACPGYVAPSEHKVGLGVGGYYKLAQ